MNVPNELYAEYGKLAITRDQIEMRMGVLRQQIVDMQRKQQMPKPPQAKPEEKKKHENI